MIGDKEDQERRDALVLRHMGDGGKVAVLFRIVAELFSMTKFWLRLAMHAAAGLGGLDDRGHIVGVAIDGDTTLEDVERNPSAFK